MLAGRILGVNHLANFTVVTCAILTNSTNGGTLSGDVLELFCKGVELNKIIVFITDVAYNCFIVEQFKFVRSLANRVWLFSVHKVELDAEDSRVVVWKLDCA
jgi:hypothetical protein